MVDFNINVRLDPSNARRGARQVEGSLNRLERRAQGTSRFLRNVFATVGAGVLARQLLTIADSFTQLQNRLRVVTDSQAELNGVFNELFNISERTRSSLQGTTELYSRLAISANELGTSQSQLLQFTESLNQAIILSGASAQEANAGLIQLSQGLASGTLRGDELRSVLEQLPAVADVIARGLGVTRGELRALGAEGRITANQIIDAFAEAREELNDRFARTIPTVAQSFTVLNNSIIRFIGETDTAFEITRNFSRIILTLSDNIDEIGPVVISVGAGLAAMAISAGAVAGAIGLINAALALNPFGALLIVIGAVVAGFTALVIETGSVEGAFGALREFALSVWADIARGLEELGIRFDIVWSTAISSMVQQLRRGLQAFEDFTNGILQFYSSLPGLNLIPDVEPFDFTSQIRDGIEGPLEQAITDAELRLLQFNEETSRLAALTRSERFFDDSQFQTADEIQAPSTIAGENRVPGVPSTEQLGRLERRSDLMEQLQRQLEQERSLIGLNNEQRELENRLFQIKERFSRNQTPLTLAETAAIRAQITEIQNLETALQGVEEVAQSVFGALGDEIVSFVETGEFNFARLARSIISDLARIATEALIVQPLVQAVTGAFSGGFGGGIGGGGGNIFSNLFGNLFGFQEGGSVTVGGTGGPDSQLFAARVSPGERIDFTPAGESRSREAVQMTSGRTVVEIDLSPELLANIRQETEDVSTRVARREINDFSNSALPSRVQTINRDPRARGASR